LLNTVLGNDSSASDKLIVEGGATGTTGLNIINAGGTGDATVQDGIMVVEVAGTSAGSAFTLDGRVAAGAYEYFLFKGGVSANTEDNWYLRNTIAAEPQVPTETPSSTPAPGTPALPPAPPPGSTPTELYRIEVPTYAVVPPVAHHLAVSTLGTFHERRGEQTLLHGGRWLPTSWGRVLGQNAEMDWSGTVAPSFDGNLFGFQAGQDLLGRESENGHHDRIGLFVGHASIDGDVRGQALGWNDIAVGDVGVSGTSFGGYWTHIGPQGWYLDGILMGTWFSGDATSNSNVGVDIDGTGVTASLEGGYPFALTPQWTLEPQAQLIWNHLSLDDQRDRFSSVSFDSDDVVTGRLGLRLQGNFQADMGTMQPYLKANLWHNFSADQTTRFDDNPIITEIGGTSLELGGGIVTELTGKVSLFATADYTFDVDGGKTRIFEGNIGLNVKW